MGPELELMEDHDLLAGGVVDGVEEARAGARRWARLMEFHRRREADFESRHGVSPHFTLTPRAQIVSEVSALWGLSEARVRHELNVALFLEQFLPGVWTLCSTGQLDCYRASVIADNVRHAIDDPVQLFELAGRLQAFLERHLSAAHGVPGLPAVVTCTPKQLRNKLTYELNRLRPVDAEERHRKAKTERRVWMTELPDAMAHLGVTATLDQVLLADHRLTHAARQLREEGDERTLAQLRSDVALALLTGCDDTGGTVVPAGLARAIAAAPDATWYRMLTDPAGQMVELSTTSYKPTDPIWRHVVAEWSSCFEPTCQVPATRAELDHRVPWPRGATTPGNLWPGCKRGHTTKHAAGFSIDQDADGSFVLRTAAGFTHQVSPPAKPVADRWPDLPEVQFSASELLEVLAEIRDRRDQDVAEGAELQWEHDTLLPGVRV